MTRSLRPYALVALAAVALGFLENLLFGSDSGGARHQISVAFFLLFVVGLIALVVVAGLAVVRRLRAARVSR